ncbi:MAG: glycerol kinase GlpK [Fimbriimonadaceae bacterium]|nr:glycerol kinase GlpK [Fimbriimonadaceae bacterium]
MSRYVFALDQGTTSSRAILFDHTGAPVQVAQREFPQIFPQPGWVEHDPEAIWRSQLEVARGAMVGVDPAEVAAIGIANQRETTVLWDRRTGEPIGNAIVWQDRRTADLCERLRSEGHEPSFRAKTGLLLDPYFSGTKLRWMLDAAPDVRERAQRGDLAFGTVDAYLLWRLTGGRVHATDVTNASRTLLFDIHRFEWDEELLSILGIPRAVLPEVRSCSEVFGETDPSLFGRPIPIAGIAGDQQAATFGQGCLRPGMVKNTYGTGCFLLANTGPTPVASPNRLLTTPAWRIGGATTYALEGSVFVAGAAIQWLRDELGLIASASEAEALAASVPDTGGVFVVPAFAGLGAPYWDPYARGTIVGLTRGTTKAHLVRATLESLAYQTLDVLEAMRLDSGAPIRELRVDGGASQNDLLMQVQADLAGVPVVRPTVTESTAFGAAALAGLAVGFWASAEEAVGGPRAERTFEPSMSADERECRLAEWRRAVDRSHGWTQT